MAKDKVTKIGTLTKSRGRARRDDIEGFCAMAFRAAKRDGRPYFVGSTGFGLKIAAARDDFPSIQTIIRVDPTGEAFKIKRVYA